MFVCRDKDKNYLKLCSVSRVMIKITYDKIISTLIEEKNLTREELELKINEKLESLNGLISREGAAHIVANDLGVKLVDVKPDKLKIKELFSGMNSVELCGKVLEKYELREFQRNGSVGKVFSVLLGDETGKIRLVFWDDIAEEAQKVEIDDVLLLKDAYSRENRNNFLELHLGNRSEIEINPEGVIVNAKEHISTPLRKKLSEIKEDDNLVEVMGTLVQMYGMTFFEVCGLCSRRARMKDGGFQCNQHGLVKPKFSSVMNIHLDDGTDNVRIALFSDQIKQLLGKSDEQIEEYKDNTESLENLKHDLLGVFLKIEGKVNKNDVTNALEIISRKVSKADPNQEIEIINKDQ